MDKFVTKVKRPSSSSQSEKSRKVVINESNQPVPVEAQRANYSAPKPCSGQKIEAAEHNDVGNFVGRMLSDGDRRRVLLNCWDPTSSYGFPVEKIGCQNRSFQIKWLDEFKWLAYSKSHEGAFCKWCVAFAPNAVSRNAKPLGHLVTSAHKNWKKAKEDYHNHQRRHYHQLSAEKYDAFIEIMKDEESLDIRSMISNKRKIIAKDNRIRLEHIIEVVEFCGRQELALRGHRDSGPFSSDEPHSNDGVFRAALRLRLGAADQATMNLFQTAPRNASYISWDTQNQIINCIAKRIQNQIVRDVSEAKYFSVLADETSDRSRIEQLSLSVRFVKKNAVHEEFLCFVPVESTTGEALAQCILTKLAQLGLDVNYLRGQGYDGASNMSGAYRGVQARIRSMYPLALYTHCCSHVLNLVVSSASQLSPIRNAMGVISEICVFLSRSAQRAALLKKSVETEVAASKRLKLKPLCETRWIERHDSVLVFMELLPAVYETLDKLQTDTTNHAEVAAKASQLFSSICNCSFLLAVHVIEHTSAILLPLSVMLQKKELDIFRANELLDEVLSLLLMERKDSEVVFKSIFQKNSSLCEKFEVSVTIPRRAKQQIHRDNYPADDPETFFRQSVYIPYMDQLISELESRFQDQGETCSLLWCLIPKFCTSATGDQINRLLEKYQTDIESSTVVLPEVKRWLNKWENAAGEKRPSNAIEALSDCTNDLYPNVRILLQIVATLPVSTATAERSFSTLRRLKTYLRTTMKNDRLTGLALLSINRHRIVNKEEVLKDFVACEPRRIDFGL